MIDPLTIQAIRSLASDLSADSEDVNRLGGLVALLCDALFESAHETNLLLRKLTLVLEQNTILLRVIRDAHEPLTWEVTDEVPADDRDGQRGDVEC